MIKHVIKLILIVSRNGCIQVKGLPLLRFELCMLATVYSGKVSEERDLLVVVKVRHCNTAAKVRAHLLSRDHDGRLEV